MRATTNVSRQTFQPPLRTQKGDTIVYRPNLKIMMLLLIAGLGLSACQVTPLGDDGPGSYRSTISEP